MRWHQLIAPLVLVGVATPGYGVSILYVDQDRAIGNGPGTTWSTAWTNLQDALTAARVPGSGVREIRIAAGTYTPDVGAGFTVGDRDASFVLTEQLALRGSYAGIGAPDPNFRDPALHETTLSGDLDADDGPGFDNTLDNAHQVVKAVGLTRAPTLDGLTVAAGNKFGSTTPDGLKGSGVQVIGTDLTVNNCRLELNRGGAIYVEGQTLTVTNSVFDENDGGIEAVLSTVDVAGTDFIDHESPAIAGDESTVLLDDCLFSGNRNQAVSLLFCSATVSDCTFDGNVTNGLDGAGLWATCVGGNVIDILDSTFMNNVAVNGRGGGVYINAGSPHSMHRVDFDGNAADAGGGAHFPRGDVYDCTFTNNMALATSLGNGGGLVSDKNVVVRCEFRSNTAEGNGGGAWSSDGTGNFGVYYNCTFSDNEALSGTGGGLWCNATRIMNCLISGNTSRFGGGGLYVNNASEVANTTVVGNNSILEDFNGALIDANSTATNCIFWDNNGSSWENNNSLNNSLTSFSIVQGIDMDFLGANNSGADPLFVDADGLDNVYGTPDDDCRLMSGSPAIDAGDNGAVPLDEADLDDDGSTLEVTPLDLDDMARFLDDPASADTGAGTAPLVDLGPYEFVPGAASPPCAGDANGDNTVNFDDLNMVLDLWTTTDAAADLDESGLVDFGDLNEVLARWGNTCMIEG